MEANCDSPEHVVAPSTKGEKIRCTDRITRA